ncbi:hypothetical protein BDW59DRAFT_165401 [Aspergillus cavernicola]|uniref:Uncharacterized protein n=1 Tax=Aspergillus cavernicola TaxID=176166 RepID=A0ABR4HTL2_9EURO
MKLLPAMVGSILAATYASAFSINLFEDYHFQGDVEDFNKDGLHVLGFPRGAKSWFWSVSEKEPCCVHLISGEKYIGMQCKEASNVHAEPAITKVIITRLEDTSTENGD